MKNVFTTATLIIVIALVFIIVRDPGTLGYLVFWGGLSFTAIFAWNILEWAAKKIWSFV